MGTRPAPRTRLPTTFATTITADATANATPMASSGCRLKATPPR
jgi:hypothetical protein